jgi:hypothetical protein
MEENPYEAPGIPGEHFPKRIWRQHRAPRYLSAITAGLMGGLLIALATFDDSDEQVMVATAVIIGTSVLGYTICLVVQVIHDLT